MNAEKNKIYGWCHFHGEVVTRDEFISKCRKREKRRGRCKHFRFKLPGEEAR
jgi:hypothetical protein